MRLIRYSYPTFRSTTPALAFQRSPWFGLEHEINRLFESALTEASAEPANRFPVDLFEDKSNVYVRAELPGVNRDDVSVEMVDGYLTLTAKRTLAAPAATGANASQASETVTFTRSVNITEDIQTDGVTAAYENGILTVTLPKREEAKPKKITVAVK